jgi:putative thioredoxin
MTGAAHILAATRENFAQLVLDNSDKGLVLVDFWAPWVGPSLRQRDMLVELAEAYQGRFLLVTVNTDEQKRLAHEYGVRSLPSFKLFRNGRVIEEYHGVQPQADYRRIIDGHLAGSGDRIQAAALHAWQQGDADKALRVLAEGAMAEPDNLALPLLLAKFLLRLERIDDAFAVLAALSPEAREDRQVAEFLAHLGFIRTAGAAPDRDRLEQRLIEAPDDRHARYQLAALALVADDLDAALQQLMTIVREEPDFQDGLARTGLAAVFNMLDPGDDRIRKFRTELFNLIH